MNSKKEIVEPPDWRDENQYPNPKYEADGKYASAWAWEYLRRNPIYQENYDRLIGEWPDLSDHATRMAHSKKITDPDLIDQFRFHFGISTLMHYRSDIPPKFITTEIIRDRSLMYKNQEIELYPGDALVRINLAAPLGPQMKQARKKLAEIQKDLKVRGLISEIRNNNSSSHVKYLRLLDAKAQGADPKEASDIIIGSKGYKDNDAFEYNISRAKKFLNGGYRIIAAYSPHIRQTRFPKKI